MTSTAVPDAGTRTRSVSELLAEHVVSTRFADLPPEVVEKAKDLLVYHMSLAFAGHFSDTGRRAVALARELSAGGGASTVIGDHRPAALLDAIFANAELIRVKQVDSFHLASKLRPGLVIDPVVWALGEREHASGRELITALVVAHDVAVKLAEPQPMSGGYARVPHKCAFAPFLAAAAAARLLGQDRAQAAETIARAAHYGSGLNTGLEDAFVFSAIARNGVMAALVPASARSAILPAIEGPQGIYAALFGGPPEGLDASLATLGRVFSILGVSTHQYAGSASHIAVLEAGRELVTRHRPTVDEVQSVVATLPYEFRGRFEYQESRMARAANQRDRELAAAASLHCKLALLLVDGKVYPWPTLAQYDDPRVRAALAKVRLEFAPIPDDRGDLAIVTTDGRTLAAEGRFIPYPKGDWSAWLREDGERLLPETKLARLVELLTHLEDVDDVGEVLACTVADAGRTAPSRGEIPEDESEE